MFDGVGLDIHREDVLVEAVVHALQHGIMFSILAFHREIFLNTLNAFQTHVLSDFHRIGTPWGNHLATRANKITV